MIKASRMLHGFSAKDMAILLCVSYPAYKKKENNPNLFTIGEIRLIMGKLNLNPLEIVNILTDPQTDPQRIRQKEINFTQKEIFDSQIIVHDWEALKTGARL